MHACVSVTTTEVLTREGLALFDCGGMQGFIFDVMIIKALHARSLVVYHGKHQYLVPDSLKPDENIDDGTLN